MKPKILHFISIQPFLLFAFSILFMLPSQAQHSWNQSAVFTGSNYISSFETQINNHQTGALTVEMWVKLYEKQASMSLIGKTHFRILTQNGNVRVQENGSTILTSNAKIDSGVWTHVAVSFNKTTKIVVLYINGSKDNEKTDFVSSFGGTPDSLFRGKSSFADNLKGELDEVRIWNYSRTAQEISNFYKTHIGWNGLSSYDSRLLFCETYDFDIYAESFYLPHGGKKGTFNSNTIGKVPSRTIAHNTSVYFSGNTYLESPSGDDPDVALTGAMTVEAWINPTNIGQDQVILDLFSAGTGYLLQMEFDGGVRWTAGNTATFQGVLKENEWHHVAVVMKTPTGGKQAVDFYFDGKWDRSFTYDEVKANSLKLRIGVSQANTKYFTGYIDEVRISNFAKTAKEISTGLHVPTISINQPTAPKSTVAYNFDGTLTSGTRLGNNLTNKGARFSYASEEASPLFHIGQGHEATMDSFIIKSPLKQVPSSGTAGYTTDTIQMSKSIVLDENKFNVFLALNHKYSNDLKIELIAPFGDSIILVDNISNKKNFTFLLDNNSKYNISSSFVDLSPRISGKQSFDKFKGKNSQGVWTLKITDKSNGNIGFLYRWGIKIDGVPYVNSVDPFNAENTFMIFPNPTSHRNITLKNNNKKFNTCTVDILNLTGQIIFQKTFNNEDDLIEVSLANDLLAGTYLVRISSENGVATSKLIFSE